MRIQESKINLPRGKWYLDKNEEIVLHYRNPYNNFWTPANTLFIDQSIPTKLIGFSINFISLDKKFDSVKSCLWVEFSISHNIYRKSKIKINEIIKDIKADNPDIGTYKKIRELIRQNKIKVVRTKQQYFK